MNTIQKIDYSDWIQTYQPIMDKNGDPQVFDTHSDWTYISAVDPLKVWSLVDSDNGEPVLVNGRAIVNRLQYYVTDKPFNATDDIEVD